MTVSVMCNVDHFTSINSSLQVLTGVKPGNDSVVSRPLSSGPPRPLLQTSAGYSIRVHPCEACLDLVPVQ